MAKKDAETTQERESHLTVGTVDVEVKVDDSTVEILKEEAEELAKEKGALQKEKEELEALKRELEKQKEELLQAQEEVKSSQQAVTVAVTAKDSADILGTVVVAYNSVKDMQLTTSKGEKVLIKGSPLGKLLDEYGNPLRKKFGFTRIEADVWEDLHKRYQNAPFIAKGKMFVHDTLSSALDEASDKQNVKHGYEQLDMSKSKTKKFEEK